MMTIDQRGNVGIGTTSPGSRLEINDGGENPAKPTLIVNAGNHNEAAPIVQFDEEGETLFVVEATGNVGIGTTSPREKLDVSGNGVLAGSLAINKYPAVTTLDVEGTAAFSGNVGIGTTSPKAKLDVKGAIRQGSGDGFVTTHPVGLLASNKANAFRYEIARLGCDRNDWASTSVVFVEAYNKYYEAGGYKKYEVRAGYSDDGGFRLVEATGHHTGQMDNFRLRIGSLVSSNEDAALQQFYLPIYVDVDGSNNWVVMVTHAGTETTSNTPGPSEITVYENPAGTPIDSFIESDVVYNEQTTYFAKNVGIGTVNPSETLSVVGKIESTTGGFKFPNGSIQTAAVDESTVDTWVSNNDFSTGNHTNDSNASTKCNGTYVYLNGDGQCRNVRNDGDLDDDKLSESEVDSYVSNNGYLTSYTETDPSYTNSAAAGISSDNIDSWNSASGWGNHASAGYMTSLGSVSSGFIPRFDGSSLVNSGIRASSYSDKVGFGNNGMNMPKLVNILDTNNPTLAIGTGQYAYIDANGDSNDDYNTNCSKLSFFLKNPQSGDYFEALKLGTNGKVGIGISKPKEALSVVGKIESTTGGFKFPDGTTQTSAVTESTVDTWAGNNGYAVASSLATVATTGKFADLGSVPAGLSDGDNDTLADLGCSAAGQQAQWNGSAWACVSPAGSGGVSAFKLASFAGHTFGAVAGSKDTWHELGSQVLSGVATNTLILADLSTDVHMLNKDIPDAWISIPKGKIRVLINGVEAQGRDVFTMIGEGAWDIVPLSLHTGQTTTKTGDVTVSVEVLKSYDDHQVGFHNTSLRVVATPMQ